MLTRSQCDEELRAVSVGTTVSHGKYSSSWMSQVLVDLVFKLFSVNWISTSSRACWISALNHKVCNDSMENRVVVISSSCKLSKVATSVWGVFPIELNWEFAKAETSWKQEISHMKNWIKRTYFSTHDVSIVTIDGCHSLSGIPVWLAISIFLNVWKKNFVYFSSKC